MKKLRSITAATITATVLLAGCSSSTPTPSSSDMPGNNVATPSTNPTETPGKTRERIMG